MSWKLYYEIYLKSILCGLSYDLLLWNCVVNPKETPNHLSLHDQLSDSFAGYLETELHSNKTATSMALQMQCPDSISQTVPLF